MLVGLSLAHADANLCAGQADPVSSLGRTKKVDFTDGSPQALTSFGVPPSPASCFLPPFNMPIATPVTPPKVFKSAIDAAAGYSVLEEPYGAGRPVKIICVGAGASGLNLQRELDLKFGDSSKVRQSVECSIVQLFLC